MKLSFFVHRVPSGLTISIVRRGKLLLDHQPRRVKDLRRASRREISAGANR